MTSWLSRRPSISSVGRKGRRGPSRLIQLPFVQVVITQIPITRLPFVASHRIKLWVVVGETKYLRYRRQEVHFSSWSEDVEALTDALSLCYRGSRMSFGGVSGASKGARAFLFFLNNHQFTYMYRFPVSESFVHVKHTLFPHSSCSHGCTSPAPVSCELDILAYIA